MKLFRFFNKDKVNTALVDNHVDICKEDLGRIKCYITGKNNVINIKKLNNTSKGIIEIYVRGDNNNIEIGENLSVGSKLIITLGKIHKNFGPISNVKVLIGKNNGIGSTTIITYNSNSEILIGEACMFAFNTFLFHTDAHPIIDKKTNEIINKVKKMQIGNHVWVGGNVSILKNTIIPDDSILGMGAIVTGDYNKKGTGNNGYIIVGNPAKIIRDNITWCSNGSGEFVQNTLVEQVSGGGAPMSKKLQYLYSCNNVAA